MLRRPTQALLASACVYVIVTAILGREVLAHLGTHIASDPGDPLLIAGILQWSATHLPLSEAWWQLPIFAPMPDAMAFSEHFLGVSVLATPVYWITRDPVVTYNVVMLLTFPLSALAMFALVRRLTGSAAAAFVAGLAFGFAPYRMSQLPHLQVLAVFWAPFALFGLHAYLDTGRRRWLALYGGAWLLQALANGYMLFFFSLLVALWVCWFVIAARRWRALGWITLATLVALLPLSPILFKYRIVHARHGFERSLSEIQAFSADVAAVLCAAPKLAVWGFVRAECRPEGELFPGVAILALCAIAGYRVFFARPGGRATPRWMTFLRRLLGLVSIVYAAIVVRVLLSGRLYLELGPFELSASSIGRPLAISLASLAGVVACSPSLRAAARRFSGVMFYVMAGVVAWLLTFGPTITIRGRPAGVSGPFAWLMVLPGIEGLRVPARFWIITVVCLAIVLGMLLAELLRGRSRFVVWAITVTAALGVLADGWIHRIESAPRPQPPPGAEMLRGATVLTLPLGDSFGDIAAQFRAVTGGWTSVNGLSGFFPNYYPALQYAMRIQQADALMWPFQQERALHVLVPRDRTDLRTMVEAQPDATFIAQDEREAHYRLPPRFVTATDFESESTRLPVVEARSICANDDLGALLDGDPATAWKCFGDEERLALTIDLGERASVHTVVQSLGVFYWEFSRALSVETSEDGMTWQTAWRDDALYETVIAAMRTPRSPRIVLSFEPRPARYLRLRFTPRDNAPWTIADLEIWGVRRAGL